MIRTLVLFSSICAIEPVPEAWINMFVMMNNQGMFPSSVSNCNENEIKIYDICYNRYGNLKSHKPIEELEDEVADEVFDNIDKSTKFFDIVVAGQTPAAEKIIKRISTLPEEQRPSIIVRFSMYYNQTLKPYEEDAKEIGYNYDCPKDFQILYSFLTYDGIIKGLQSKDKDKVKKSIASFNSDWEEVFPHIKEI